jgi:effector-binding domain-containing protein
MLTLVHRGPYSQIGRTYEQLMRHAKAKGLTLVQPSREIYIKGPGMFFRGNPAKYLTEVQLPISAG